jgi:hypothetical protein
LNKSFSKYVIRVVFLSKIQKDLSALQFTVPLLTYKQAAQEKGSSVYEVLYKSMTMHECPTNQWPCMSALQITDHT